MRPAIAYIRVSTKEQGQSGFGLESQKAQIEAYAAASGYEIEAIFSDVASAVGEGSVAKRPGLSSAIHYARQRRLILIVARLDRLARHSKDLDALMTSELEIVSIDQFPKRSPLAIKSLAKKVETETELLKKRTREGLERARERGMLFGNRTNLPEAQAKGSMANHQKARERYEKLAPAIAKIRGAGFSTYRDIAQALNDQGWATPRGRPWTKENVRRVIEAIDRKDRQEQDTGAAYANVPGFGDW